MAKSTTEPVGPMTGKSYSVSSLLGYVIFLDKLLSREFVCDRTTKMTDEEYRDEHCKVLHNMIANRIFDVSMHHDNDVVNSPLGENSETQKRFRLARASSSIEN